MDKVPTCFFAYPSSPAGRAEVIEEGITQINNGQTVVLESWKKTNISGKFIMQEICKEIDNHNFFACDITRLNPNVLFELGYAVARKKRVWITRDPSVDESNKDYTRLELLTTIGYSPCTNSQSLEEEFYRDRPYEDLDSTIYKTVIENIIKEPMEQKLLYLKSCYNTEASIKITRRINKSSISSIVDDPIEVQTRTLNWYIQNVFFSCGMLAHLIGPFRQGWQLHNAKYALFSGLAYGFGKPLLMLVEEPYESPIDYKDLLRIYKTARQCNEYVEYWTSDLEKGYQEKKRTYKDYDMEIQKRFELQNISIGDCVAENESEQLLDYFVETAAYTEALHSQQSICVGRKGTGKTANLYKIAHELRNDKRNLVSVIQPVEYELEGVMRMFQQSLPKAEQGYLIESFWKFLIYTELAKSIIDRLREAPLHYQPTKDEKSLSEFVESYSSLINNEFSIRLEYAVKSLCNIDFVNSAAEQRVRISEILHSKIIGKLTNLLGNILSKNEKVVILVDNLDKTWKKRDDLQDLCQLLFGLLKVIKVIKDDFQKPLFNKKRVNLSLLLFLRSDIFNFIIGQARERDKINYSLLSWDNPDLLLRVIEERFSSSCDILATPNDMWIKYFCSTVKGKSSKDYILERIIPRPRDIIYICKASIEEAINSGHNIVEANDVLRGEKKYSEYVFGSLLVENGIRIKNLESILYEFTGSSEILSRSQVITILKKVGVEDDELNYVIDVLLELTFFGLEIDNNQFTFLYNENDKSKYRVLARKFIENNNKEEYRYAIHKAFHAYLEIE